jgi:hypothetical protein
MKDEAQQRKVKEVVVNIVLDLRVSGASVNGVSATGGKAMNVVPPPISPSELNNNIKALLEAKRDLAQENEELRNELNVMRRENFLLKNKGGISND